MGIRAELPNRVLLRMINLTKLHEEAAPETQHYCEQALLSAATPLGTSSSPASVGSQLGRSVRLIGRHNASRQTGSGHSTPAQRLTDLWTKTVRPTFDEKYPLT